MSSPTARVRQQVSRMLAAGWSWKLRVRSRWHTGGTLSLMATAETLTQHAWKPVGRSYKRSPSHLQCDVQTGRGNGHRSSLPPPPRRQTLASRRFRPLADRRGSPLRMLGAAIRPPTAFSLAPRCLGAVAAQKHTVLGVAISRTPVSRSVLTEAVSSELILGGCKIGFVTLTHSTGGHRRSDVRALGRAPRDCMKVAAEPDPTSILSSLFADQLCQAVPF
jgi:hypothetical protein